MASRKPTTPATPSIPTHAERIRQVRDWVQEAESAGAEKSDLVLKLTHRDVAALKRHPSVQPDEIAFSNGVMRFLGVRVAEGGVADSVLEVAES